jgi:bacterial/archaeal transporter family protein
MGWVGWSVVALVCWGAWAALNKLALRTVGPAHLLIASWIAYTVTIVVLLMSRVDPRALVSRDGAIAIAGAMTSVVAAGAFYLALRSGPVATITPLSALYPAITAVLAVVLLREDVSLIQWVGVGLAVLAGAMLTRFA